MNNQDNKKQPKNANGDGTLYFQEKTNRWICQVTYYSPSGQRKRKSFSAKTKTEVKKKRKDFERELALGRITETSNCTVVDLLKEAIEYDFKIGILQEAAYTRQLYTVKIINKSTIGSTPIVKLTEDAINTFLLELKIKYSNSVISKVFSALRRAYRIAISKRLLMHNLMDSSFIKKPKSNRQDKKVYAFTCEEEAIFLEALKEKRYRLKCIDYNSMFMIELFAGLRMGEICALTPNDIDLKNNVIHVRNTITRGIDYEVKVADSTKTPRGCRDVPINKMLVETLEKVLDNYVENKYNLLFYNEAQDRPVSTQQANSYFRRLCTKIGLQPIGGQHLLRHTFATRCIEAEIPAEVLMRWMGHTDISITITTYCDIFAKMHDKAIEKFTNYCNENLINKTVQKDNISVVA